MTDPKPWIVGEDASDVRRHAPATLRNRGVIAEALAGILPPAGLVLEIASGSGEHVAHFAERFPTIDWQPSDPDAAARASIAAWCADMPNVATPLDLDAGAVEWPIANADAILCSNMVHVSPWAATEGLLAGAGRLLAAGAPLILYGPFLQAGVATADSNLAFDRSLRERDPAWGLRPVEKVTQAASVHALRLDTTIAMPANNLALVYRKLG